MKMPFVGRTAELRCLSRYLDEGRNIVLTGSFGSGRTTLVRALASALPHKRFVFWGDGDSRRAIRVALEGSPDGRQRNSRAPVVGQTVLVADDVVHLTAPRTRFLRELVQTGRGQIIVIVERSMPNEEVARLRAALGAARLMRLGPVSSRMAERYFSLAAARHQLRCTAEQIRGTARSTHGHPLTMRTTLELAVATARSAAEEIVERSADAVRLHEKRQSHGDGVRRWPSGLPPG
jgi:energy-coupling factor transporter ATP-binding protein EcfA2